MRIDIITVLPELLKSPFDASILKRAIEAGLVEVHFHNLRDYTKGSYKAVDDTQFGGGAGMVMLIEPIDKCITKLQSERNYDEIIYMTPDGERLNQSIANQTSLKENIIILCGHYKGVDQRVRDKFITREISIGDYVLSGGEQAAMVILDAVVRLLPGILGKEVSHLEDRCESGLLEHHHYTQPRDWQGLQPPKILLSGHHQNIAKWRQENALDITATRRPDLMAAYMAKKHLKTEDKD